MPEIKTFEEACAALGLDPTHLPEVSMLPEKHQKAIVAHYKLITIAEALNEGWQPNWNNWDEYKYYPWFEVEASEEKPAGFGLSLCDSPPRSRARASVPAFAFAHGSWPNTPLNSSKISTKNTC